jgi:hypothetical protein
MISFGMRKLFFSSNISVPFLFISLPFLRMENLMISLCMNQIMETDQKLPSINKSFDHQ